MCLVRVHEEPEVVPYRVISRRSHYSPPRSRVSRTIIEERRPPSVISHRSHHYTETRIASPPAKAIPPPQPVPVFVKPPPEEPTPPPPAPPKPPSPPPVHYIEVSPSSSHTSVSQSDYIVREHEIRRERTADYSPARSSFTDHSPRYESFRYVEPPPDEHHHHHHHHHHRHWSRSSERSMSRDRRSYRDEPHESRRSTRIEVSTSRRPREYWR